MIRSYYFFHVINLDDDLRTAQQQTIPQTHQDAEPVTALSVVDNQYCHGLSWLQLRHETIDRTPRRMLGDPQYVQETIAGGQTPYDVYWNESENFLIVRAPKSIISGAFRRLHKAHPQHFKVERRMVDFSTLIDRVSSTVIGAWFGLDGRVTKVGMFGNRVNLDESFDRYQQVGSMTALYIVMEFQQGDVTSESTIMITKDCGVVIFDEWEVSQDLQFLTAVIKPLIYDTSIAAPSKKR